jgi:hypothetical protein
VKLVSSKESVGTSVKSCKLMGCAARMGERDVQGRNGEQYGRKLSELSSGMSRAGRSRIAEREKDMEKPAGRTVGLSLAAAVLYIALDNGLRCIGSALVDRNPVRQAL